MIYLIALSSMSFKLSHSDALALNSPIFIAHLSSILPVNHHLSKTVVKIRACMRHKLKPCPLVVLSRIILTQSFILHPFMINQLIHAACSLQSCCVLLEKRSGIICNVKLSYVIIKCALIFFAMNIRTLIFSKHTKKEHPALCFFIINSI